MPALVRYRWQMPLLRRLLTVALAASVLGCVAHSRAAPESGPTATAGDTPPPAAEVTPADRVTEHWYRLDVDETPAGWMLSREVVRGDRLTTVSRLHLRFQRASTAQTLELESRFEETTDGRPLAAWSRQRLGPTPIETTWKFLAREVLVEMSHGGESRRQRVPLPPGSWLTPGQIQPQLGRLVADGVRHFTLNSLDPQLGLEIVATEWRLEARDEELLIDGAPVRAHRFRQRQSIMPQLETVTHVDDDGLTLRSVTPMMGFEMTATLSRREEVLEHRDAPELLVRTFVSPDRPIRAPRRVRRALYEIEAGDGFLEDLPRAGAQRVEKLPSGETSGAARVRVEIGSGPDPGSPDRGDREAFLRASTFVDHESAAVRELLAEADAAELPPARRAEALRAFVAGHLRDKNLDSILATAGEVATSGSGDCTEHSVLLTALLRASDIPARVVTGLIYVAELAGEHDVFGYHMWTQAWVGDHWLDLDATLEVPFDAAHIAFGTTALNDDQSTLTELAKLAALIGRAKIRVLEVEQ